MANSGLGTIWAALGLDLSQFKSGVQSAVATAGSLGQQLQAAVNSNFNSLNREVDTATSRFSTFSQTLRNSGQAITDLGGKLQSLGGQLTALALPLKAFGAYVLKTGTDFSGAMANIQAITGATAEEMELLEKTGRRLAAQNIFSATEAAQAILLLAQTGRNTQEIIRDLEGTMAFAAATGTKDLAVATETVTAAYAQFAHQGLSTMDVANILAATITKSNMSVQRFVDFMPYAGAVGQQFKFGLEEIAAVGGVLAETMGQKMAMAGTGLQAMFKFLVKPTDKAAEALARYGLTVNDVNPALHDMETLLRTLIEANFSARDAAIIFGVEGGRVYQALKTAGIDAFTKMRDTIVEAANDGTLVLKMQETQLNSTWGMWEDFKSSVEELALVIYDILEPALQALLRVGMQVVDHIAQLDEETMKWVVGIGAAVAGLGPALLALGSLVKIVGFAVSGLGSLGTAFTVLTGPVGLTAAAIAGAVYLIVRNWDYLSEVASEATTALIEKWQEFVDFFVGLWTVTGERVSTIWTMLVEAFQVQSEAISGFVTSIWTGVSEIITSVMTFVMTFIAEAWDAILSTVEVVTTAISGIISQHGDDIMMAIQTAWDAIVSVISFALDIIGQVVGTAWEFIQSVIETTVSTVYNILNDNWDTIVSITQSAWTIVQTVVENVMYGIQSVVTFVTENIVSFILEMWGRVTDWFERIFPRILDIVNWILGMVQSAFEFFRPIWEQFWDYLVATLGVVWETITAIIRVAWEIISGLIEVFLNLITGNWEGAWNAIVGMFQRAWDAIKNIAVRAFFAILKWAASFIDILSAGIVQGLNWILEKAINWANALIGALNKIPGVEIPKIEMVQIQFSKTTDMVERWRQAVLEGMEEEEEAQKLIEEGTKKREQAEKERANAAKKAAETAEEQVEQQAEANKSLMEKLKEAREAMQKGVGEEYLEDVEDTGGGTGSGAVQKIENKLKQVLEATDAELRLNQRRIQIAELQGKEEEVLELYKERLRLLSEQEQKVKDLLAAGEGGVEAEQELLDIQYERAQVEKKMYDLADKMIRAQRSNKEQLDALVAKQREYADQIQLVQQKARLAGADTVALKQEEISLLQQQSAVMEEYINLLRNSQADFDSTAKWQSELTKAERDRLSVLEKIQKAQQELAEMTAKDELSQEQILERERERVRTQIQILEAQTSGLDMTEAQQEEYRALLQQEVDLIDRQLALVEEKLRVNQNDLNAESTRNRLLVERARILRDIAKVEATPSAEDKAAEAEAKAQAELLKQQQKLAEEEARRAAQRRAELEAAQRAAQKEAQARAEVTVKSTVNLDDLLSRLMSNVTSQLQSAIKSITPTDTNPLPVVVKNNEYATMIPEIRNLGNLLVEKLEQVVQHLKELKTVAIRDTAGNVYYVTVEADDWQAFLESIPQAIRTNT